MNRALLFTFFLLSARVEAATLWFTPTAAVSRASFDYGGTSLNPGRELVTGIELGVHLMTASAMAQALRVGLDLRQGLGGASDRLYRAKLGVRLDWNEPAFRIGASWFFGDTLVVGRRDRQFNGNSTAVSAALTKGTLRPFVECTFGSYQEGPGFIFLPRRPGDETVETRALLVGIEFPLETAAPEWLYHRQP